MPELTVRRATAADVPELVFTVQEGFESYRAWAPAGWSPPAPSLHAAGIRERLARDGCVCLLAQASGAPAGHVAYLPAAGEAGVAHLWMLFVRRALWGTGVADELLARAVAAATREGYAGMRLHTPAAHARARAFYERAGWTRSGPAFHEPALGLELVTYRLAL
jgi:GNAT superfamily N-acetyltransferase